MCRNWHKAHIMGSMRRKKVFMRLNTIETTDFWIPNTLFAREMSRVFFLLYFY